MDGASYGTPVKSMGLATRIILGALGGLVVGVIVAVLLGVSDSKVRRRERVEDVTGNALIGTLVDTPGGGVVDLADGGVAVERLRELRTNIQFARVGDGSRPHVITVASPSGQDGRSTTAINLASVFAEAGHSVLLVDGDFVNPALPQLLGLHAAELGHAQAKGLTTVLIGQTTLAESTIRTEKFELLPAGPVPSERRQLWGDDAAPQVIDQMRQQFDYVIIDTPPLVKYADGTVPAALGDGAVLLGRIGHTKAAALRKAMTILQTAHVTLIGVAATCEPGHRKELPAHKAEAAEVPTEKLADSKPGRAARHRPNTPE